MRRRPGGGDADEWACAGALRRLARALTETGLPPRPADLGLSAREVVLCLELASVALETQGSRLAAGASAPSDQGTLSLSPQSPAPELSEEWDPGSSYILHADGGSRGNPGPAGIGAALLDSQGRKMALLRRYLGVATNNVAEYQGLIMGLRAALDRGVARLEVRLDSELLVRQLQGRYKVKAPHLVPLYQEAKALLARFELAQVTHIPRSQNTLADKLANQAIDDRAPRLSL